MEELRASMNKKNMGQISSGHATSGSKRDEEEEEEESSDEEQEDKNPDMYSIEDDEEDDDQVGPSIHFQDHNAEDPNVKLKSK